MTAMVTATVPMWTTKALGLGWELHQCSGDGDHEASILGEIWHGLRRHAISIFDEICVSNGTRPPSPSFVNVSGDAIADLDLDLSVHLESRRPADAEDRDTGMIPIHVAIMIPVPSPLPSTVVADGE
ncbi:hypothetical protein TIFTF001_024907 [Ficus carica]|uniref:Uncharacterized protein n=1 Tax=Ficus carica TaxID=3494 RepID=A0AA88DF56_FICCA|nr:hypothetical protein TIFTF001_024907 [Ficus carica]